ncbi:MAG TPA: hypothetical protein VN700_17105 [Vicinamibacterales bacterium]|nr:hypothetical protein [Vicinamibacterales bacterium]
MIPVLRHAFNRSYTDARHQALIETLTQRCGGSIDFRLSETPCFFPSSLIAELETAARAMIDQLIGDRNYRRAADAIVPPEFRIPNGEVSPTFVQVDFGLVRAGDRIEGRLVELQAFPSLYGFQMILAETARETWQLDGVSPFPNGLDRETYLQSVGAAIVGGHDPAEVVLMEIDPEKQKTRPDFAMTERLWGVRAVDVRAVSREGRHLYYDRDGRRTRIRRVYNRVIPDDLSRSGISLPFDYRDDLDVEWTGGPDWFFRLSKFSIPFLRHPWVPRTHFLSEAGAEAPAYETTAGRPFRAGDPDWLLKPLFSYAGGGIIFGPTQADIDAIPAGQRHLYVLQERVQFTPVIDTPFGATQAEIRLMFVGNSGSGLALVLPLIRMGRGKMMGVDHNKGLSWVGAAAAMIAP